MTTLPKLDRILATKTEDGIELVVQAEGGENLKVLASREQVQRLIAELGTVAALADASE